MCDADKTDVCVFCGKQATHGGCGPGSAQTCPNMAPSITYVEALASAIGNVPDTDAYYADDDQYR